MVREFTLWDPFDYAFSFDTNQLGDRVIIYGLYSSAYVNGHEYLVEIEAVELSNLLNDYNTKIAELTTQEQVVLADIVSRRYLAGVEKVVHDQKLVVKRAGIDYESAMADARTAALATDQAALDTMNTKLATEITKTGAKVTELQAYLAIEGYNLSEIDIQIAEKELQSAEIDIKKLNTANEILKLQIDIVNVATQLVDVDVEIARTRVSIASTDRSIANIGLLDSDLLVAQAQTKIADSELAVSAKRVVLAEAKSAEVDKEIDYYANVLPTQVGVDFTKKVTMMELKNSMRSTALAQHQESSELAIDNQLKTSTLGVSLTALDAADQVLLDAMKVNLVYWELAEMLLKIQAALEAQATVAAANIATTLTHTIKKKTT
jgi:hypothetical protein